MGTSIKDMLGRVWEDEKKHVRVILDYLKPYAVAILIGGVLLVSAAIVLVAVQGLVLNAPSEEQCQKFQGNNSLTSQQATSYWCEYDGNEWHFNKTHYREMMIAGAFA